MFANEHRVKLVADIVDKAGKQHVLPGFRAISPDSISTKTSQTDIVTQMDIAAEEFISTALLELAPGSAIVGEEVVESDPNLLRAISDSDLCFIVDPIDGTLNYAWGLPIFGTIIAIVENGVTTAGLIFDHITGEYISAIRGGGAYSHSQRGLEALNVSSLCGIAQMNGIVQTPQYPKSKQLQLMECYHNFNQIFWYGCSASEYRLICSGKLDFSLQTFLKPWDHAAGHLIHQEAGGHSALLDGEPYLPSVTRGGLLLARDKEHWEKIRSCFSPMSEGFWSLNSYFGH